MSKLTILIFWVFFIGPLITIITTLDGLGQGLAEWVGGTVDIWKRC